MLQSDPNSGATGRHLNCVLRIKMGDDLPYSIFSKIERVCRSWSNWRVITYTSQLCWTGSRRLMVIVVAMPLKQLKKLLKRNYLRGPLRMVRVLTREDPFRKPCCCHICYLFLFVYLFSAQHEKFLITTPCYFIIAGWNFGSLFIPYILGLENNIYAEVAMVMLIGLLGKMPF